MKTLAAISVALFLTSCVVIHREPTRPVKMEKGSAVDLRTALDAADLVWNSMQRIGCRQTDVIVPTTMAKSSDFQAGEGRVVQGRVKERWVARGCNIEVPYIVEFIANKNNVGGTDINIRREKGGS